MPTLFQTKKCNFPLKGILQIHFEFAYFSFFLTSGIDMINTFTQAPPVPSKTIPVFRPKWRKKTLPDGGGGAHTYIAYVRRYPPPLRALGDSRRANCPLELPGRANVSYISLLNLVNHFLEYKRLLKLTFLFPRTTFLYYYYFDYFDYCTTCTFKFITLFINF